MPGTFAQGQGEVLPSSSKGILKLAYTKLGVAGGTYQQISYDSTTNSFRLTNISSGAKASETEARRTIISSSQRLSQSQSKRKLSEADQMSLRHTITNNGLFQANSIYPPDPGGAQGYTLQILSVTIDNKPYTVIWSSTSSDVPSGLASITKTIEDLASK
jgi:hypothetical protein